MRIWVHDKAELRAKADAAGQWNPVLRYPSGGAHELHLDGHQPRVHPKDRTISGKARRRQELAERREAQARIAQLDAERAARLPVAGAAAGLLVEAGPGVGPLTGPDTLPA